ncbi:MAG: hypothetical protein WCK40_05310 [Thermoleophilia bacterium]
MADTALAGLPRIVRASAEIGWRGQAMMSLGLASACYWTVVWLVDGPVQPLEAGIVFAASLLMSLVLGGITSRRRVTHALANVKSPRAMVHETPADARERHTRAASVLLLGAVVLLVLDTLISQVGATAALLAGAGVGIGIVDRAEARRWTQAEGSRSARLFLMIRPTALLVRFGATDVFELPGTGTPKDDDGPPLFDLP